jgi:pimeloyl-ACP methyl ester carboxylesterase
MATIVLVHGGYHGGWCWKKISPSLRVHGHDVYTPTLTGLGERVHLLSPNVNLSTHIQDIANVLVSEDLNEVVLVGHSYGGTVITGVAELVPERLQRLVQLDASIPEHGQAEFDPYPEIRERWLAHAIEINGARVYLPSMPDWLINVWGIVDPDDLAWMTPRLTPHPLATMEEPISLPRNYAAQLPRSYIRCSGEPDQSTPIDKDAERALALGCDYHELETGHIAMVTAPAQLVSLLLRIAEA